MIRKKFVFLVFAILLFFRLDAQDKIFNIKIVFDENVNMNDIIVLYDNGTKTNKLILRNVKEANINTICLAPYLKITILGLYKEEKYDNYEEFYVEKLNAEIFLYKNPNKDDNLKYLFKLQNVLESKNMGAYEYNKTFEKNFDEFAKSREEINRNKADSLRNDSLQLKYSLRVRHFEEEYGVPQ